MKSKIIMKVSAVLMAVGTIYVVLLWEPSIKTDNNTNISDETTNDYNTETLDDSSTKVSEDSNEITENKEEIINEENINKDAISSDLIITIDFTAVMDNLELENKTTVKNILKKLSVTDYSRFINMLSSDENNGGAVKAFQLLKRRISTEDYKVIEELLDEYIDFSIIDTKV